MRAIIAPIVHPASILRGRFNLEPAQILYLRRAVEHMRDPTPLVDCSKPPSGSVLFPSLEDLERFDEQLTQFDAVSHDLENAGPYLICDGMTPLNLETGELGWPLCLRFRVRGGGLYWSWPEHIEATRWLYKWLADDHTKVFHNGVGYDLPFLENLGFKVNGRILDTMVMAHYAYSEFPKGLQFCATLYLGAPVWKSAIEESDDEKD